jgi:hypothetical protein
MVVWAGVAVRGGVGALGGVDALGSVGALGVLLLGEEWAPLAASMRGAHFVPSVGVPAVSHPLCLPRRESSRPRLYIIFGCSPRR